MLAEYSVWLTGPAHTTERPPGPRTGPEAETLLLDTLLRLKSDELKQPDPGLWTQDETAELLTEVVPRTVIQVREAAMDLVPALSRFFVFLQETGRWHEGSMGPERAARVLGDLEFEVLEAADDPSRRSFSTNILGYGIEHGLDPRDENALLDYMSWYDALPDEERTQLSSTGRLPDPSIPFIAGTATGMADGSAFYRDTPGAVEGHGSSEGDPSRGAAPEAESSEGLPPAAGTATGRSGSATSEPSARAESPGDSPAGTRPAGTSPGAWPWFLPTTELDPGPAGESALGDADAAEAFDEGPIGAAVRCGLAAENLLVQRAIVVLETVGDGIDVTATQALDRAATARVMERLGISRPVRTMWEVPQIVGAWVALIDGGWLVREGRRIVPSRTHRGRSRPDDAARDLGAPADPADPADPGASEGPGSAFPYLSAEADPEGFTAFAHAVMVSLLAGLGSRTPEEGGLRGMPATTAALMVACERPGLTLRDPRGPEGPAIPIDPRTGREDSGALRQFAAVSADLEELADVGLLTRDGQHYRGSPVVLLALYEAIRILREE